MKILIRHTGLSGDRSGGNAIYITKKRPKSSLVYLILPKYKETTLYNSVAGKV